MTRGDAHWDAAPVKNKFRKSVTVTTTAATTATAAATSTAATVFTAGTTITAGTFFLRTSNVDRQRAIAKVGAVHGFNRLLGFFRRGHGHEGKTA